MWSWRDCRAAVDNDRLPGDKGAGARGEQQRHPGNVLGLAEAAQRRGGFARGAALRVLVKHPGELGLDETRGNAIDPDIVGSPFGRKIPAKGSLVYLCIKANGSFRKQRCDELRGNGLSEPSRALPLSRGSTIPGFLQFGYTCMISI